MGGEALGPVKARCPSVRECQGEEVGGSWCVLGGGRKKVKERHCVTSYELKNNLMLLRVKKK